MTSNKNPEDIFNKTIEIPELTMDGIVETVIFDMAQTLKKPIGVQSMTNFGLEDISISVAKNFETSLGGWEKSNVLFS